MAKTAKSWQSSFAHTKETLGSIVFALIIALVFRGFVGQAFVIPTGSMAPTLSGAHVDHTCSSCGYSFTVGMDDPHHPPVRVQCPSCSHEDLLTGRLIADAGDGIFTLSWPFAVGGPLSPQRWDVVVFKAPFRIQYQSPEREGETNYIKRLIGVPGDIIEIIDGDVYLARAEEVSPEVWGKLLHAPLPAKLTPDEKKDLDQKLRIVRKTPAAQEALWQVLFDADYVPSKPGTNGSKPAWKAAQADAKPSKWNGSSRVFHYDDTAAGPASQPSGAAVEFLELVGKDFRDNYGYNTGGGVNIVSDLRLGATINWQAGDGIVQLCLSKRDDVYTVELRPGQGSGRTLLSKRSAPGEQQELKTWAFATWKRNQAVRVVFANVDHHLEVRINDRVVWEQDLPLTADQVKREPKEASEPLVRIGAANVKAEFSHLHLSRDVHYQENAPIWTFEEATRRRISNEYSDRPGWATRDNPMLLRDDEYFVLGDNSPKSLDSRRWWQTGGHLAGRPDRYRPGTVPADQMIGQAFCVYWPSWYRLLNLRVIPNIGEMRWIQ
jgi:signal peptidase I